MANSVGSVLVNELQVRFKADAAHSVCQKLGHAQFTSSWARDVHHLREGIANVVWFDEVGDFAEVRVHPASGHYVSHWPPAYQISACDLYRELTAHLSGTIAVTSISTIIPGHAS